MSDIAYQPKDRILGESRDWLLPFETSGFGDVNICLLVLMLRRVLTAECRLLLTAPADRFRIKWIT